MAFDLESYKRVSGRLAVDDIDFSSFRTQPLRSDDLRCLGYMHDVEQHTSCYLRNLLNTKAHLDPEVTTFLTMWSFEEMWHGEALGRVLEAHGEIGSRARVAAMRSRLGWRLSASPAIWMAFSAATKHFLAVHMTFGVVNEWTTQGGYARLAARSENPVLQELLRRIMRQEGRHIDYYLTKARDLLSESTGAQRTTSAALRRLWSPVGAKVMPVSETRHLITSLFGDDEGRTVAARIDRRIDSLPGLDGLKLMDTTLRRFAA